MTEQFSVIRHRACSTGQDPSIGYAKLETKIFDSSATLAEVISWAVGNNLEGFAGDRMGLFRLEISLPPSSPLVFPSDENVPY